MDKKNLLWDLGNTLLKIDGFTFARQMGLMDVLLYPLLDRKSPKAIYYKAFDLLDRIKTDHNEPCDATAQGRPLPPIVCEWLAGKLSLERAQAYLNVPMEKHAPNGFFKSDREAHLVKMLLKTLTDPQSLITSIRTIKEGIDLLDECAQQLDKSGNQRHSLFVLSNWDPYSFDSLLESLHFKELFKHFKKSNLIISGDIGLIKPHKAIYSYVIDTYKLNPSDCILIDDQPENIKGAQQMGMKGIHLYNGNYQKVRDQLKAYKAL